MTNKKQEETIKSLLLPLLQSTIIIPNANIAEIVSRLSVEKALAADLEWFLGYAAWRGHQIPVISLDHMNGPCDMAADMARANYAIFYSLHDKSHYPFYAMVINGVPHFEFASEAAITEKQHRPSGHFIKQITINGQEAMIPDLDAIENSLQKLQA